MITPKSPSMPTLHPWQKIQAAMLYHFASIDYLKELHQMVSNLIDGTVDPLLALSKNQNRDSDLSDPRWGTRNTRNNWSNKAWPFLRDLQLSLAKAIAGRAFERYGITDTNYCFRGMSEYSMQWTSEEEEENFKYLERVISEHAIPIDQTFDDYHNSRWRDSNFAYRYREFASEHPQIPKFRVRTDVVGKSGKTPSRTGVYVAQDDPYAALQFAWTGNGGGKLRPAKTFSDIGLDALSKVGRKDLWLDDQKMFGFAMQSPHAALFRPTIYMSGTEHRDYASMAVANEAFVDRPCEWYFVEIVNGEFEDIEITTTAQPQHEITERLSGGDICRKTGFYFTPAHTGSRRRLIQGEAAPEFESQYGKTIWQWDTQQD
jgi:hypothetical protein